MKKHHPLQCTYMGKKEKKCHGRRFVFLKLPVPDDQVSSLNKSVRAYLQADYYSVQVTKFGKFSASANS